MRNAFIALAAVLTLSRLAYGADSDRDSRAIRADEQKVFFSLVCTKQTLHDKNNNCAGVVGYPEGSPVDGAVSISLDAIAYGSFTQPNQAYVTYTSVSLEAHADNFGGGILFARAAGKWKLVRWYRGGQMDHCLALPAADLQTMLCLSGYTGQGETDSSIWLRRVPKTNDAPFWKASISVLKAQDAREAGVSEPPGNYQCTIKRAKGEAILLSIDDLKRSKMPGVFAESSVTYVSAGDANEACRQGQFADVRETKGIVRYRLQGTKVVAVSPAQFAKADY